MVIHPTYGIGIVNSISDDKRYYQEYTESGDRLNFLKQNLSKYKNIDIKTISNTYFI